MSTRAMGGTPETTAQPDEDNKLSWSTAGSVEKNTPHLTKAHEPLLSESTTKTVLEIASGFLDHCSSYARQHSQVQFWPTECDDYLVGQLERARQASGLPNIQPARLLDVLNDDHWESLRNSQAAPFDVITATNLLNVSPWSVTKALFEQVGRPDRPILNRQHGRLAIYCCLKVGDEFQSEADAKFDATLRARKSEFGIRNLDDVVALAEAQGMKLLSQEAPGGGTNLFLQFTFA